MTKFNNFLNNVIYCGLFFPELKLQPKLKNEVKNPHITLKFRPTEDEIQEILNSGYKGEEISFSGYECSQNNEGISVISLEMFGRVNKLKNPHITVSYSENSTPVKTGELNMREKVPQFYINQTHDTCRDDVYGEKSIYGQLGFFLKGGKVVLINDLISDEEEFDFISSDEEEFEIINSNRIYKKYKITDKEFFFIIEWIYDDEYITPITKKEYEDAKASCSKLYKEYI